MSASIYRESTADEAWVYDPTAAATPVKEQHDIDEVL